jgi:EpsI family protein
MNKRDFIIVVFVLLFSALWGNICYFFPQQDTTNIAIESFPKVIGDWVAQDALFSNQASEISDPNNFIMRFYVNSKGEVVNLFISYSQSDRKASIPPIISLQGKDATIVEKNVIKLSGSVKAIKLIIETDTSRESAVYWYKVGSLNTHSFLKQQFEMVVDRIRGRKSSVAVIRVLTPLKDEGDNIAFSRVVAFCRLIEPLLPQYVP